MVSKIANVFSDPVFNVTKLQDWNLSEIVRHRLNRGKGCILIHGNYVAASCAGALKRSWMHRHVRSLEYSSLFTDRARLCGEILIFQQDNSAIYTARRLKDFSRQILYVFWIILRVRRTWTLSRTSGGWMARTFMKVERSLRLLMLSTKLCSHPDEIFRITSLSGEWLSNWLLNSFFPYLPPFLLFLVLWSYNFGLTKLCSFLEYACFVNNMLKNVSRFYNILFRSRISNL